VSSTIEAALAVALDAHTGQAYPAPKPEPFILHPLRVMLAVTSPAARIVALLHDVVEDSSITLANLAEKGFDPEVLEAVACLTRGPAEPYADYIDRVASNGLAREVKLADLADNLANNRRLPSTRDTVVRIQRYERAVRILEER